MLDFLLEVVQLHLFHDPTASYIYIYTCVHLYMPYRGSARRPPKTLIQVACWVLALLAVSESELVLGQLCGEFPALICVEKTENRGGGNNNQVTMSFFGLLAVFFFGMLQFFGASLQPHGCTPGLLGVSRHHERWD